MKVLGNRVLVKKVEEQKKEGGFAVAETQDNFIYKGEIVQIGTLDNKELNTHLGIGSVIMFAKYSPDTNDIEYDGIKYKFVSVADILAVL